MSTLIAGLSSLCLQQGKVALRVIRRLGIIILAPALLCALHVNNSVAEETPPGVYLLVANASNYYSEVATGLSAQLKSKYPQVTVASGLLEDMATNTPGKDDLIITIGTTAAKTALQTYPENKQLSVFLTSKTWNGLLADTKPPTHKAAIFIDQPFSRYLLLARALAPQTKAVSMVFGPQSIGRRQELLEQSRQLGLLLKYDAISMESNPLQVLAPLFREADVFVGLPDQGVINRKVAQWALHFGFKNKIPVIGFSQAYTDAGAAASLFTAPEDIVAQTMDWLANYFASEGLVTDIENEQNLWRGYEPAYFSIAINSSVANILGLSVVSEMEIHQRIESYKIEDNAE